MADLRDMELIAALARHRHFARAAEESGISQPAFSARIRNLETTLGVPVVRRGNRFLGFTPEGEIVLKWARRILVDADGLRQEVQIAKGALTGRFQAVSGLTSIALYDEQYVLMVPPALAPRQSGSATWKEAAELPLCLLTPNMRNRQIIDGIFAEVGATPKPVMETNAFVAALAQVASGALATIAPVMLADTLPIAQGAVRLRLEKPDAARAIGLVMAERDPQPPALRAFSDVIRVMAQ